MRARAREAKDYRAKCLILGEAKSLGGRHMIVTLPTRAPVGLDGEARASIRASSIWVGSGCPTFTSGVGSMCRRWLWATVGGCWGGHHGQRGAWSRWPARSSGKPTEDTGGDENDGQFSGSGRRRDISPVDETEGDSKPPA
ncbi:hypothetical protein CRG98_034382 [Punica granatum]|uniref:Uncharacterized protein n=1 Tax=Punica granatum TaxID=22663 RepID=A0A2I0IMH8_PUNGR|nr:hypothetical protein CRG98_034382 [Punica granatum]